MLPHIRLNMIVKNEAAVILRCLASVKPFIHSWVIVDTGSSDGTQQMIRDFMQDVPGQLFERPWKNFGHNRTEALQLAKSSASTHTDLPPASYLLFIDADETLQVATNFQWPELNHPAYHFECIYNDLRYHRNALVSTQLDWSWVGVLHEYLDAVQPHHWQLLNGLSIFVQHDSARGKDPQTYQKDITLLQQGIQDEPDNLRYQFYLGQSFYDAGLLEQALQAYQKRAAQGGWEEERWMAQLRAAQVQEQLHLPFETIFLGYFEAWLTRPQRAEAAYNLSRFCRLKQKYAMACHFAKIACATTQPHDILFIDYSVYRWRALDELSVSATYCLNDDLNDYKSAGLNAIETLLNERKYPLSEHPRITANKSYYTK